MSLPKISNPLFSAKLPSNGDEVTFRPFLVKEEKALLIASEAKDSDSTIRAVCQVLQNCIVSPQDVDVSKLPTFDIEYMFLKLRAKSIGETTKLRYMHSGGKNRSGMECDGVSEVEVDLDSIECVRDDSHVRDIKISEKYTIRMKYPTINTVRKIVDFDKKNVLSGMMDMIADCIECVYDDENKFEPDSRRDASEFVESMTQDQLKKLVDFFSTMPRLTHSVEYTCPKCSQVDTLTLRGLNDFF